MMPITATPPTTIPIIAAVDITGPFDVVEVPVGFEVVVSVLDGLGTVIQELRGRMVGVGDDVTLDLGSYPYLIHASTTILIVVVLSAVEHR